MEGKNTQIDHYKLLCTELRISPLFSKKENLSTQAAFSLHHTFTK